MSPCSPARAGSVGCTLVPGTGRCSSIPLPRGPARVRGLGSMTRRLGDEVRAAPLAAASRDRLGKIFETSVSELSESLSPDLQDELQRLAPPFGGDGTPTDAELRIAQAQLVGW